MAYEYLLTRREGPVEHLTLNRPDVRNAFNEGVIAELADWARGTAVDRDVRVVVLAGAGKVFCAGADIAWMSRTAKYSKERGFDLECVFPAYSPPDRVRGRRLPMHADHRSELHLPEGPDVPYEMRFAALEQQKSAELMGIRRAAEQAREAVAIRAELPEAVRSLMGSERYERFRRFASDQRERTRNARRPPGDPTLTAEKLRELAHARRERSAAFLRELGVEPARVRALTEQVRRRVRALAEASFQEHARLVADEEVPADIRAGTENPWTKQYPPFPGSGWEIYWWGSDEFTFGETLYLDKAAGMAGHEIRLSAADPGDADLAYAAYRTSVGFWYKMPKAGLVEAWIKAQCGLAAHRLYLEDEWGWSDSFNWQKNYLTLQTWGSSNSELRRTLVSSWEEDGYTDENFNVQWWKSGDIAWAHLFSDVSYAKDAWVYVDVGTRTATYCVTNDVEMDCEPAFKWFIQRVSVQSTGS